LKKKILNIQNFFTWNKSGIIFYQFGISGIILALTWNNLAKKIWRPWSGASPPVSNQSEGWEMGRWLKFQNRSMRSSYFIYYPSFLPSWVTSNISHRNVITVFYNPTCTSYFHPLMPLPPTEVSFTLTFSLQVLFFLLFGKGRVFLLYPFKITFTSILIFFNFRFKKQTTFSPSNIIRYKGTVLIE
jgi:hypothetical protein